MLPIAIDTHAHLFLCQRPLDIILRDAEDQNVRYIVNVGINMATSLQSYELYQKHNHLLPTLGIHPCEEETPSFSELDNVLERCSFRAIGEIGLDYYHTRCSKSVQITRFEQQLELARKYHLPVIIHNREADQDMARILPHFSDVTKVIHCFSSDSVFSQRLLSPTTFFSFTGLITYSKKEKVWEAIKEMPLSQIMIETDSPYLTPAAFSGKENQPAYVLEIARKIAELKMLSLETVLKTTSQTAMRFFKIQNEI